MGREERSNYAEELSLIIKHTLEMGAFFFGRSFGPSFVSIAAEMAASAAGPLPAHLSGCRFRRGGEKKGNKTANKPARVQVEKESRS